MHRLELLTLLVSLGYAHVLRTPSIDNPALLEARKDGYDDNIVKIDANAPDHNQDFYRFVTRPDIDAPRWNIQKHNESAIAPGYWFLAPYQDPRQKERGGGWVGPHIYDGNGELIWSGVPMLNGFDAFDFKVSNYKGQDMLSMIYRHENGILINSQYELEEELDVQDEHGGRLNMHDFSLAENGTTALMLKTFTRSAEQAELDAADMEYECRVHYYGFEEHDIATGEVLFDWRSQGIVGLEETVFAHRPKLACHRDGGLDYIHANALDKFPDGDYLLSARHCNALFKISAKDGSIVWRFGGKKSDFKWNGHFSGQHHARVRGQNSTHTMISFLDNAYVPSAEHVYSNDMSRGFLIALRTDQEHMTAETIAQYDHPDGGYAPGRGSYQTLPNGNTYVGWTSYSLFSEYDADGNLILEANLRPELKSYRSYKFPWVGHPAELPSARSVAVSTDRNSTVTTSVHVSWNGATEVATWKVYHTKADGSSEKLLASSPRQGFETALTFPGYAKHVVVEAYDSQGKALGKSDVVKTVEPLNLYNAAVLEEDRWQQESGKGFSANIAPAASSSTPLMPISAGSFGIAFGFGILCCAIGILVGFLLWRARFATQMTKWPWQRASYEKIKEKDDADETLVGEETDQMFQKKRVPDEEHHTLSRDSSEGSEV
ncbi:hypothetical protein LTR09_003758 [Extremus antarcticus]|uniref:ASST-domain-containing protein n=1 Tax=Extremus antarcticus TaxID=702011 RepID=A0AAJ0DRA4_9PEZI|nr:hypothetical protein LTR09_003758 [Extremus antarcticus]